MELGSIMMMVVVVMAVMVLPFLFRGGNRESNIGIQLLKL